MKIFQKVVLACILACMCAWALYGGSGTGRQVSAGTAGTVIADYSTLFQGSNVNYAYWRYTENAGINAETRVDGRRIVRFGGGSTGEGLWYDGGNPLTARTSASMDKLSDSLTARFTLRIVSVGEGKRFGFAFGISKLVGDVGENGSYFLYFMQDKGVYQYGLSAFDALGEIPLIEPTALPSSIQTGIAGSEFEVVIAASGTDALGISIAGDWVYSKMQEDASYTGYVTFTQDGVVSQPGRVINVEMSDVYIYNTFEERPYTPAELNENFDAGDFDMNSWRFTSIGSMYVKDGKMIFERTENSSVIGTQFVFSEFEFTFTMGGFRNTPLVDRNMRGGKVAATSGFGISFGYNPGRVDFTMSDAMSNGYYLRFTAATNSAGERAGNTIVTLFYKNSEVSKVMLPNKYDFFNYAEDAGNINMSLKVDDGFLTLGMQTDGDDGYTDVMSYEFPGRVITSGNINFWVECAYNLSVQQYASYNLDNLHVKNLDMCPNLMPLPEKKSSYIDFGTPPVYTDTWDDSDLIKNYFNKHTAQV